MLLLKGAEAAKSTNETPILTIATISSDPIEATILYLPVANYFKKKLSKYGIKDVVVKIVPGINEIRDHLKKGDVNIYIDSPLVSIAAIEGTGSKIIGRRWKEKISSYHSVIFTKKDTQINQIKDLNGRLVAFEEPFSSSGYFLPKIKILKINPNMKQVDFTSTDRIKNKITYKFSNDDQTTLAWVLQGRVDAGAMSQVEFEKYSKKKNR